MAKKTEYLIDPSDNRKAMIVGEWAQEKHDLIAKYIDGTRSMRSRWPRRTYVELFCGPGRVVYGQSGPFAPGSALRAWEASRQCRVPFTDFYINDIDAESVDICTERLENAGAKVHPFKLPADQAGPAILKKLGKGLHLVLLDPFSIGVVPFNVLVKPVASHPKVDLMVNYNVQDVTRNLHRNLLGEADELDRFCPGWSEAIRGAHGRRAQRGKLLEHWLKMLRESGAQYSKEMPLVRDTRRKNTAKYYMVFASHHPSPIRVWGDVARNPNLNLFVE
jgi:three-Cys-motif partner protein